MKRSTTFALVVLFAGSASVLGQGPTPQERQDTIIWIQKLQRDNGGFAADNEASRRATMPATVMALRALKFLGGKPANPALCEKFVLGSYDAEQGVYVPRPGEGGNVLRTTAHGMMAATELGLPADKYLIQPVIFLCSSVKKYDDICLAAAAYESVKCRCELAADWIVLLRDKQNPDGTFGKGASLARDTAVAAVTILRLGGKLDQRDRILQTLKAAQFSDGGWGKAGESSDLETTYHVIRALVMLGAELDADTCSCFVARCRQSDGSYAMTPEENGSLAATYFATSILHWLPTNE